jgi:hypothetical protein
MSDLDWGQSLANVRKAYRVVAAYQQRVQAMMKIAGREFEPLEFANWFATQHNMPPRRSTDTKDLWTWDLLPMNSCAVFLNENGMRRWDIKTGETFVFFAFTSDSGFWHAIQEQPGKCPDPSKLEAAEDCETSFQLYAFQWLTAPQSVDCWHDFWDQDDPDGIGMTPATSADGRWQVMYVEEDLANLETEEAFTTHVRTFRDHVNTAFRLDKPLGAA